MLTRLPMACLFKVCFSLFLIAGLILFVVAALLVDRLLSLPDLVPNPARVPVSIPLMVVGIAATAWSGYYPIDDMLQVHNPPHGYIQNNNVAPDRLFADGNVSAASWLSGLRDHTVLAESQQTAG